MALGSYSKAQWRTLQEIRAAGERRYSGRMERTLKVLERHGEILLTCEVRPDALRGRHGLWWIATVAKSTLDND